MADQSEFNHHVLTQIVFRQLEISGILRSQDSSVQNAAHRQWFPLANAATL